MPGHNTDNIIFKKPELKERYTCPKCFCLLKDAVQTYCGHWLCKTCAEDIYKDSNPCCPKEECGERFTPDDEYFPDRYVQREILNLLISCPNSHLGCGWEGKFCELQQHLTTECEHRLKEEATETGQDDGSGHELDFGEDAKKQLEPVEIDSPTASKVIALLMREIRAKEEEIALLKAKIQRLENRHCEGSMLWPIPQVSRKLDDARTGKTTSIFSPPFYTGRHGYKIRLRVYLSGDGNGNHDHMSLFFVLMKGEFDNILQWPFKHKVTFKLLNQSDGKDFVQTFQPDPTSSSFRRPRSEMNVASARSPTSSSFQRPRSEMNIASGCPHFVPQNVVDSFQPDPTSSTFRRPRSDMNIASGCPRFISHAQLNNGGFVKDDVMFIKCIIDTSTIQHP